MLTIPTIGWVAKLGPGRARLASYSIAKYGAQTGNDWQWFPDAGNGIRASDGRRSPRTIRTTPTSPSTPRSSRAWCSTWSGGGAPRRREACATTSSTTSRASGSRPTATSTTSGPTMDEIRDYVLDYGGQDQGRGSRRPDRRPGGMGLVRLLLQRLRPAVRTASTAGASSPTAQPRRCGLPALAPRPAPAAPADDRSAAPRRLHRALLPAGGRVRRATPSSAMQLRRNRSTRSLWDPNYVDETWIGDKVRLIPRLRELGERPLPPGHADRHHRIQLGRRRAHQRGHDPGRRPRASSAAKGWISPRAGSSPDTATPTFKAFQMYRNYDGNRLDLRRHQRRRPPAPTPTRPSVFAAQRTVRRGAHDHGREQGPVRAPRRDINLVNFTPGGTAQVYRLASTNPINHLADVTCQRQRALHEPSRPERHALRPARGRGAVPGGQRRVGDRGEQRRPSNANFTVTLSAASASTVTSPTRPRTARRARRRLRLDLGNADLRPGRRRRRWPFR